MLVLRSAAAFVSTTVTSSHRHQYYYASTTSSTSCLQMAKNKKGKTISKTNLPSKICVVCERPFTWRKKWERDWDEITTCSKSCNAKRKKSN